MLILIGYEKRREEIPPVKIFNHTKKAIKGLCGISETDPYL